MECFRGGSSLKRGASSRERQGFPFRSYTVEEYTYGIHSGSHIWAPSLVPFFMDTTEIGLAPDTLPHPTANGDGGLDRVYLSGNSLENKRS